MSVGSAREEHRLKITFPDDALNNLREVVVQVNLKGMLVWWNRAASDVTGYSNEELSSMKASAFFSESGASLVDDMIAHATVAGRGQLLEVEIVSSDGERLAYEFLGGTVEGADAELQGILLIGRYLENVATHAALQESDEKYRDLIENASVGIIIAKGGKVSYCNQRESELLGHKSPADVMGHDVTDLIDADDIPTFQEVAGRIRDGEAMDRPVSFKTVRPDGEQRVIEAFAIKYPFAGEDSILSFHVDVTDRSRHEEELQKSEERYRSLFESSLDGIVFVNMEGYILEANQAYLDMLGYTLDEARELTYQQLTPEEYHQMEADLVKHQITVRGYSDLCQKEYIRKDGIVFPINIRTWLFHDNLGVATGTWAIVRDITEQRKAEDDLRRTNAELEGFAHTVSHDLRSPLTAIAMANETLRRLLGRPISKRTLESIREVTDVMDRNIVKSATLIDDILALAMAGHPPTDITDVDVKEVVNRVIEENSASISDKGVRVLVGDGLGTVKASETHVYQVFANLVRNAIKHNESEGSEIGIYPMHAGGDSEHWFHVRDNGSGIPEEDLNNIFTPFFKGETGETGIGLSIVEKILRIYDGDIRVYNDDGACFDFVFRDSFPD